MRRPSRGDGGMTGYPGARDEINNAATKEAAYFSASYHYFFGMKPGLANSGSFQS